MRLRTKLRLRAKYRKAMRHRKAAWTAVAGGVLAGILLARRRI